MSVTLPKTPRNLLRGSRTGTLTLKLVVTDQTGFRGTTTVSLPVSGKK
ncbi:MAG: hypothetical protein PGN13_14000 [Patulibacter minatonensis]